MVGQHPNRKEQFLGCPVHWKALGVSAAGLWAACNAPPRSVSHYIVPCEKSDPHDAAFRLNSLTTCYYYIHGWHGNNNQSHIYQVNLSTGPTSHSCTLMNIINTYIIHLQKVLSFCDASQPNSWANALFHSGFLKICPISRKIHNSLGLAFHLNYAKDDWQMTTADKCAAHADM